MVLESAQQPEKKWRGRPRKYPVEQTGTTRKDLQEAVARGARTVAPVTPHTSHSAAHSAPTAKTTAHHAAAVAPVTKKSKVSAAPESMTREEELAAFERHSNKSGVLTLFVLLLGVALIGYGMYNKLKQADTLTTPSMKQESPLKSRGTLAKATATTDAETATEATDAPADIATKPAVTGNGADVLAQYVAALGKKDIAALAPLQDSSFKALPTLRTYFNTTRLTTFAKAATSIAIKDLTENTTDAALKRNPTAKAYDFNLVYTLADGKEYSDAWRAYTIVKDSTTVINGFVYQGKNTALSPFFSFSKFGIK